METFEDSRLKTALWVTLFSAAAGILLVLFTMVTTIFRFAFSLGAIFLGIRFFGKYDRLAHRIWFIVLSLFFFFLFTIVSVMYLYANGMIEAPAA